MDISRHIVKKLRENRILQERKNYSEYSRDELIQMAQNGDQLAIETLVNTHQDMIINYSKKYHLDTGDFDDVKQLVTIAFWEAIQKWDMTGNFEAYAGMIIKRKMTDELRKEDAEKVKISTKAAELDAPAGTDDEGGEMTLGATLQSKSLSPEEEYLGRDGARKIMKFMKEELSDVERKVILKYIEGYKVSEISKEEDMKYKTVENAIMRVKNKLADYMRNMRESKQNRLSEESIFSDEEKQILKSVIGKIERKATINEAVKDKALEEYTDDEFYDLLLDMEEEVEEIIYNTVYTTSQNQYDELLDQLDKLHDKFISYEEYINTDNTELSDQYEEVAKKIRVAKDTTPENLKPVDKYAEVGMSRKDF